MRISLWKVYKTYRNGRALTINHCSLFIFVRNDSLPVIHPSITFILTCQFSIINIPNGFLRAFLYVFYHRTVWFWRRIRYVVAHSDRNGDTSPLAQLGRIYQYRCHFANDTRSYRHQCRYLVRLYGSPQRGVRHMDGRFGQRHSHLCAGASIVNSDGTH